ncbi:MAG TPA: LCP family protein [Dermatophilaceae bacterium]|nr:LCP family protein [Dermatophilaceae bacterium]
MWGTDATGPVRPRPGRHRARHRSPRRHPLLRRATAVAVVVLAVAATASGVAFARLTGNIHRVDVSAALGRDRPTPTVTGDAPGGEGHAGPLNVLLLGSDTRKGIGTTECGTDTVEGGAHSDTTLLVHLSADRTDVTVVSVPRDSMVPAPPGCDPDVPRAQWVVRQWNHNFTEGGVGCTISTFEGNTGVFVDHFAVVDFRGFTDMVDALGGVPVCTSERIDDEDSGLHLAAGRHRLDGKAALGYVRVRKTVGDGSDLGRIQRQQAFLSSVAQQATSSSLLLRPDRLYRFLTAATGSLTTDPGFDSGTMRDLAGSVRDLGTERIRFVTVPTEQYPADHNRVRWTRGAGSIWAALRDDRPMTSPARPSGPPSAGSAPRSAGSASPSRDRPRRRPPPSTSAPPTRTSAPGSPDPGGWSRG